MRKHCVVIGGVARIGEHYPVRARHKMTGEVRTLRQLVEAGIVPPNIKNAPEANAGVLWGEWTPIYPDLHAIIAKFHPDKRATVTASRVISVVDMPAHSEFKDAWRDDGAAITVDMPTAREIHRDRLRQMRAPLLAALDVEYMRADELGDDVQKRHIATRKQVLRDATADPTIDAARTPEELKAAIPAALKEAASR